MPIEYWIALTIVYGAIALRYAVGHEKENYSLTINLLGGLLIWAVLGVTAIGVAELIMLSAN